MGYPQPQRPKSNTGLILLFVLGIPLVLVFGAVMFCVIAVKQSSKNIDKQIADDKTAAAKEGAGFVPILTKLSTDPKSLPIKNTKVVKDVTTYSYDDPKGTPLHGLMLSTSKKPNTWKIEFTAPTGVKAQDFAPGFTGNGEADPPTEMNTIDAGPLKGAVILHYQASWWVESADFALLESAGGVKGVSYICGTSRASVKSTNESDFKSSCEQIVKEKLLSPKSADFPGMFDQMSVTTTNTCEMTWRAWVDAKNAFNATIRHNFVCTYKPSDGKIYLQML